LLSIVHILASVWLPNPQSTGYAFQDERPQNKESARDED
jgi:hypothetical protein